MFTAHPTYRYIKKKNEFFPPFFTTICNCIFGRFRSDYSTFLKIWNEICHYFNYTELKFELNVSSLKKGK